MKTPAQTSPLHSTAIRRLRYRGANLFAGVFCLVIGLYGALNWLIPLPFVDALPGSPMTFSSAVAMMLCGLALVWRRARLPRHDIARPTIAVLLIAAALAVQAQHVFQLDLGLDLPALHLAAGSAKAAESLMPGRMPWTVALALLCVGAALLIIGRPKQLFLAQMLCIAPGMIAVVALLDFALMYDGSYANIYSRQPSMSVLSAAGLLAMSIGLWAALARTRAAPGLADEVRIVRTAALVMIPVVVVAGFSGFVAARNLAEGTMREALTGALNEHVVHMEMAMHEHLERVALVAVRPEVGAALATDRPGSRTLLRNEAMRLLDSGFSAVRFETPAGEVRVAAGDPHGDTSASALLNRVPEVRLQWAEEFRMLTRTPIMHRGRLVGYAEVEQTLPVLANLMQGLDATDRTGEVLLAYRDGDTIRNFPSRFSPVPRTVPGTQQNLAVAYALSGRTGVLKTRDYRDREVVAAFGPVNDAGLGIAVKIDVDEFHAPIARQFRMWVVLLACGAIAALLILRRLVRPMALKLVRSESEARHASQQLQDKAKRLEESEAQLRAILQLTAERNREIAALNLMSQELQRCVTPADAYRTVQRFGDQLLPRDAGSLYLRTEAGLMAVAQWAGGVELSNPDDPCLQRGTCPADAECKLRAVSNAPGEAATFCIPVKTQNDVLGVLAVRVERYVDHALLEARREFVVAIAEHIGLALANLRLREDLRSQSIRDPLTGLYNRRYLEESYRQAEANAQRKGEPLTLILIDIDYFKRINDRWGHEAGDAVLQDFGGLLRGAVREGDTACRLGGEEFALLLPGADLAHGVARAEELRALVQQIDPAYRGQSLGPITASFGVAVSPAAGTKLRDLTRAADEALYSAKAAGRNRVMAAGQPPEALVPH